MKNRHTSVNIIPLFVFTIVCSRSVFAIDLNYNPELDAPTEDKIAIQPAEKNTRKHLPGERDSTKTINSHPMLSNDREQREYTESESGWTVKAPSLSSDKEPISTDERQSVKMSEEQRWQEDGKNYDDNPLNKDNYRINVEAEYTF